MARKLTRKSVSFDRDHAVEQDRKPVHSIAGFPALHNPLSTVPFHGLVVLGGMFKYGLTENINEAMLKGLLASIPLQIAYDYTLILNVVPAKKKKTEDNVSLLIAGSILTSLLLTFPIFAVLIVMGAPIASDLSRTFLLAAHLSLVLANPLLVIIKFDFHLLTGVVKVDKIYRLIFSNQVLASTLVGLLGTWLGVLPIPLDWDRPWQQWPITLLVGGYLGSVVGGLISLGVKGI